MFGFNVGAMAIAMALFLSTSIGFLGGVNPLLVSLPILLLITLCLCWVLNDFRCRDSKWSWTVLDGGIALFVVYASLRYLTSQLEYEARNELMLIVCCSLAYFVSAKGFISKDYRNFLLVFLMIFALFQASFGIWQFFSKSDFIFHWERPEVYNGRGSGTFVCPNHLAGFLEMCLGLIAARAAMVRRESKSAERSVIVKVFTIYVALMLLMGLLVTLSRAGWVSAAIGMAALASFGGWKGRHAMARLGFVLVIGVCAVGAMWGVEPIRNYLLKSLVFGGSSGQIALGDPTIGGRTMMWDGTLNLIQDNPLFGTGLGSWQWVYQKYKDYRILSFPEYTHNDYLNLTADYGLIGAIIMAIVLGAFFLRAAKVAKLATSSADRAFAVGAMVSTISILVHSWFDFNLHIFGNAVLLAVIFGATSAINVASPSSHPVGMMGRRMAYAVIVLICASLMYLFIPTVRAYRVTGLGDAAKQGLQYDEAVFYYTHASTIDPGYPKPHIRIGDIYRDQAKWRVGMGKQRERSELAQKAVESYDQALALNPYLSDVLVSRGQAMNLMGQEESALKSLLRAIEVAPVSAYAHFVLGQFYRERGDDGKALEAFEKADKYFLHNDPMFQLNQWSEREKLSPVPKSTE